METVELLAPAGDFQTALAAFEAGADAVYCGLADFSARAFATNFSFEDLENLLACAHGNRTAAVLGGSRATAGDGRSCDAAAEDGGSTVWNGGTARPRKVYVTFNTLLDEDQFDAAIETLARLEDIGPDGVIVQDLGIAKLIHDHFPGLQLHASTQLVAHNLEGVLALGELGFTRVVLARELSLEEITSIAKRCGDIELEVFIHGALCYSLSGLCLFGAMEKGRSGNRGKCPYCCRQAYEVEKPVEEASRLLGAEDDFRYLTRRDASSTVSCVHHCPPPPILSTSLSYPFSMKDLRLGEDVKKLVDAGVASLKIEGRMKSPLYVASVTKYYREILDESMRRGTESAPYRRRVTVADLETVFSRRTTELYLNSPARPATNKQPPTTNNQSPIDPESLGHLGTPVGVVKKVTRDREGRAWLRFHTCRGLEKHDGLQFEAMTDEGRHLGMGIVEMRQAISRRPVFEVNAGVDVEVLLPGGSFNTEAQRHRDISGEPDLLNLLKPGMKIYCSMSNAVKRLFPTPSFRPSDYEGGRAIDVEVTLTKEGVSVLTRHLPSPRLRRAGECRVPSAEDDQRRRDILVACKNESVRLEPAKDPSRTAEGVRKAFAKLGGTGYRLGELKVNDPDGLFVPMSVLNDLRRDLVEALNERREKVLREKIEAAQGENVADNAARPESAPYRRVKLRADQTLPVGKWDEVIVAINADTATDAFSTLNPQLSTLNCRVATPVYTSELAFNKLRSAVKRFLRAGYDKWEASDLATLRMLKELGVADITADWTLYAFNARALAQVAALGVKRFVASPENGRENLQYLAESGYDVEFLTQQSTPLFVSLTKPETNDCGAARSPRPTRSFTIGSNVVYPRDGLWVTTKPVPRTFYVHDGVSTRLDLSWDPE